MEKEPKISKKNRMSEEDVAKMDTNAKPIIEMIEGELMPIYIAMAPIEFRDVLGNTMLNFMCTILHHQKTNKLEIRGRMRYEETGNKQEFAMPKMFTIKQLEKAKKEIKILYEKMLEDMHFVEKEPYFEINFKVNEDTDDIIQKMNDSDKFNIGIAKK